VTIDLWISLCLIIAVSAILVFSGLRKAPGIGIIIVVVIIAGSLFFRHRGLDTLGFIPPKNWPATILLALGLGIAIAFLSTLVIEPASEKITGESHYLKAFDKIRGDWKALLAMLVVAWVLASLLEEIIFRGFIMTELGDLIGTTGVYASILLLVSSGIFGFAHWYQGKAGALSTALVGLLLGDIFIWSGYSLWLPILTHAVIDTVGLLLIYFSIDSKLKKLAWKDK